MFSGASSSRDSVSSATLTIVVSRIDMITPVTTTAETIQTSRPSGSLADPDGGERAANAIPSHGLEAVGASYMRRLRP